MRRFLKTKAIQLLKITIVTFFVVLAYLSANKSLQLNSKDSIQHNNFSHNDKNIQHSIVKKSRDSAVNVMSMTDIGSVASSSGTYIRFKDNYYILTVGHGIVGECSFIRIVVDDNMYDCVEVVSIDKQVDYAIIQVEKINELTAIRIPKELPKNNKWRDNLSIQTDIVYTGFPNTMGPLTLTGNIVGYSPTEEIYLHSYAWPGASGSGVFNEQGKLIGYVMAISLGYTDYGINVLEDIIIMVPMFKVDWSTIEEEK